MVEGRVVSEAPGGVAIVFQSGPGDPLAVAGRAEGRGARSAILLGRSRSRAASADGGYRIGYADGAVLRAEPSDEATLVLRRGDAAVGTIVRAETATAVAATGGTLFHFVPDPDEASTPDLFRLVILDRSGTEFGRLDVIRAARGWASHRLADRNGDTYLWWDRTGRQLPVPILGTRVAAEHPLDQVELDVLLATCTDIALGLRPYIPAMRQGCGAGR
jgi:hypothetical protein